MLVFLFYTAIFKCKAFHGEENARLASSSNKKKFTALSWTGKTKLWFFFSTLSHKIAQIVFFY